MLAPGCKAAALKVSIRKVAAGLSEFGASVAALQRYPPPSSWRLRDGGRRLAVATAF